MVAFMLGLSVSAALLAGLVPALRASRPDLAGSLRGGSRLGGSAGLERLLGGLVAGQVALSYVLLVGAGLLLRSFLALQQVELGFVPEQVLTFQTSLPFARYDTPEKRTQFHARLHAELAALPGAESVGAASSLPLAGSSMQGPYGGERDLRQAYWRFVLPG